jgi:hypothetical protein
MKLFTVPRCRKYRTSLQKTREFTVPRCSFTVPRCSFTVPRCRNLLGENAREIL